MRKIYIIFSLVCLLVLFLSKALEKNIKKDIDAKPEVLTLKSEISFEIGTIFLKKKYDGNLIYKKPNNLYLLLKNEKDLIEIGSNNNYFWYFSSYENILYYGLLSNANYLVKEIFNPKNIIQIIFPPILEKNGSFEDELIGDYGHSLKRKILIKDYKVIEQKIYNQENEMLYKVVFLDYYKNVPKNLILSYVKDGYSVNIKMNQLEINELINFSFEIPLKKYKKSEFLSP